MRRLSNPTRVLVVAGWVLGSATLALADAGHTDAASVDYSRWARPQLASLQDLSIEALRTRDYAAELRVVKQLGTAAGETAYSRHYAGGGAKPHNTVIAEYGSDGNRVYTRVDIPAGAMPKQGYPAVIFVHGWYSNEDAPAFDFSATPGTPYADVIDAFVAAGFVVFYPGWRGYGTVDGRPAEGGEFLARWNNATYLWPMFAAIDVLNLLDGLQSVATTDWRDWGFASAHAVRIDPQNIHIAGHSQGGDTVLAVLAVAGEGSRVDNAIASGSIWAGCFPSRFVQLQTYEPMATTLQAFFSGDGTWNGTATGNNGKVNPAFIFGWPPDWIATLDTHSAQWHQQRKQWTQPTVAGVVRQQYSEMYAVLNRHVADLGNATFDMHIDQSGKAVVAHDPRVAYGMERIGGFAYPQYLTEPLNLHFSDHDYYSIPAWNEDLSRRVNAAGGRSAAFVYPGNTHVLGKSEHTWFSGPAVEPGFRVMLQRDVALFSGLQPQ